MKTLQQFTFNGQVGHDGVGTGDQAVAKESPVGKRKVMSPTHREEVLDYIAELDRKGYTQVQILKKLPERFGFSLSQGDVCKKLGVVRQRYRDAQLSGRVEKVNEQLAALKDVRREAWEAYHLSMLDSDKVVTEWESETSEVSGGDLESSERVVKRITTREGRLPANQYLATIMRTHEAERQLLGLDEEVHRNMMSIQDAEAVLRAVLEAQREVLADQPQLLRAVQQRCLSLIPFMRAPGQGVEVVGSARMVEEPTGVDDEHEDVSGDDELGDGQ